MKFKLFVGDLMMASDGCEILIEKEALFNYLGEHRYEMLRHGTNFDGHHAGGGLFSIKPEIIDSQRKNFYLTNLVPYHPLKHYQVNPIKVRLRTNQT